MPPEGPQRPMRPRRLQGPLGQAGMAFLIPGLLLAGPVSGYLLGLLIQRWTGWGQWVLLLMVALGLITGIRESIRIIRNLQRQSDS
ncbi:MAG TPA: AtpZ/AtpI family protein [Candidatus Sumerlaeota bacterium]|nr:MAG: hypothetical protein BWZ08_02683 [candidate division BRC1 bacterium ADurb.BinA292]HOR29209.1 AtpZ/AtpI family protein [Candidatus Sumerlaeota bacterium]HPK04163.1 AtpZ/AtpI family protein [Candidatus Sumerlaeota bacterium]